jgi:hypothetical protein
MTKTTLLGFDANLFNASIASYLGTPFFIGITPS